MLHKPTNPGWTVLAGALGTAVGAGIFAVYGFGVLSKEIAAEFGWTRATVSFGLTVFLITHGFGNVVLGSLIYRYGLKPPSVTFMVVFCSALALVAALPASPLAFYALFGVMGFTGAAGTAVPYSIAICGWFDHRRGLALGLMNAGSGLGAVLTPHVTTYLIQVAGWRGCFLWFAGIIAGVSLISLVILMQTPPQIARQPGEQGNDHVSAWNLYLRKPEFWLIGIPIVGISITTYGVLASLVPILTDRGVTLALAAGMLSIAGSASWASKFGVGWVMDRIFAPKVAIAVFVLVLVGILLVGLALPGLPTIVGSALVGLGLGSQANLLVFLVSRYFAPGAFSKVIASMWVMWAWGGGIGTALASASFDVMGSYQFALWGFGAVMVLSVIIVHRLGPYKYASISERSKPNSYENRIVPESSTSQ